MRRVAEPLEAMGARVTLDAGDGLPMTVHGASLHSIGWTSRTASAQIKSAILLAALTARVPVTVTEPRLSRDHTERMLRSRGVEVTVDGTTISLGVAHDFPAVPITVPGDPSSAAFFVALAALLPDAEVRLPDVCLNPTRTAFMNVVQRMGVPLQSGDDACTMGGEPVGTVVARSAPHLRAVSVGADEIPAMIDEVPILAALAARADGETTVRGAGELRVKESDRIAAVVSNLRAIGAEAEELEDGLVVRGSDRPLRGRVVTHGDHRLAMAFGVLGALPGNDVTVDDPGCVAVSYPAFWDDLRRVAS
jgi:3-phosphoshikimate 1-carboxyvinyltransferase